MTIRSKLLLLYGIMLISLLGMGLVYLWTASRWRTAGDRLTSIHLQETRAEQLSAATHRQVNYGLDYLAGDPRGLPEANALEAPAARHLETLKQNAVTPEEADHIEGLGETRYELSWTLERVLRGVAANESDFDVAEARARLREIADETSDDITALNQHYGTQVERGIAEAGHAGHYAEIATWAAVTLALFHLVVLIVQTQRWLVRPIATVSRAAQAISTGDFATRVQIPSRAEWSHLAGAINHMAASLNVLDRQLRTRERLAALGEAAGYIAHNLKNPLAGIRMTAQATLSDTGVRDSAVAEPLQDIMDAVDRLDGWTRRFLDFARPMELRPEQTDLNLLVTRILPIVSAQSSAAGVTVETNLAPGLPAVQVDALLLEQAVAALVTNALESGGDRVTIETATHDSEENAWLSISVTDNGRGLSPEVQERLFTAFVTDKSGGTGLGLAQVKTIVDLHGGQVSLDSEPKRGTRAHIRLPLLAIQTVDAGNADTATE